jgi:hypothetical protein
MRKEEGATVAATPTFPHSGQLRAGRTGSVSTETTLQEAPIKYHKCPTYDTKRRRFSDFTDWPSKTDETNETKKCS